MRGGWGGEGVVLGGRWSGGGEGDAGMRGVAEWGDGGRGGKARRREGVKAAL